jgi:sugar phosphate isomerase/epimerase
MQACRRAGIEVENYHAPFGHINDIWCDTPEGEQMLRELLDSVDNCDRYDVRTLVVHLSSGERPPRVGEIGFSRIERLMAYAKEKGVVIAYENQRKLANLAMVFEEFEDAAFCWDTGHEACFAHGREYMPLFGNKLAALHVHDNHCVYNHDEHMIPYDASMDFDRVARHIAAVDYKKSLMLEMIAKNTPAYLEMGAEGYYTRAAVAARRLADAVDAARAKKA